MLVFPQSVNQFIACIIFNAILFLIYKLLIVPYWRLKRLGLDGPAFKPVFGNIIDYGVTSQHEAHVEWTKKYGNVFASMFFKTPTIWIGQPEMLQEIMIKSFSNFSNRLPPFGETVSPFDKGLLTLKDDDWKRVRNILVSTFSASKLKQTLPLMKEIDSKFVDNLIETYRIEGKINMLDHTGYFTLEVVMAIIFGIEFESKQQRAKLVKTAKDLITPPQGPLLLLFIISPATWKMVEPYFGTIVRSINQIERMILDVVKQRRNNLKEGLPCRKDILQHMIEAGDRDKLSDEELISQAVIFFVAGYDTTANTIANACYLLATHPDVQDKCYQEISDKCPDRSNIDYDTLHNLPYLDMVISETLRLYPPGFFVNRAIKEDVTINNIRINSDSMIGLPIYAIHHNANYWPDPEQFIPERFTPEEKAKRHPLSYLPFGDGPRNCIGMRLALLEVKLAVVSIIQRIELKAIANTEIPLKLSSAATLTAKNGIWLGLETR